MATPEQRSRAAQIAVLTSWARTPDRAARVRAATDASPVCLPYWIARVREEGVVREEDIPAAAENYRLAYVKRLAAKSAEARRRNREAKQAAARLAASA